MEKERTNSKILMFPWLAHGHINPFLELAKRLPTRNFTIYLCSTRVNLDSIKSSIHNACIKLVELHVPSSPELPPEMHTTKNLPSNLKPTLIKAFQMSSPNFSDILDSVKPDLLVYDMYQPWAPKLASSKGIPSVYFSTSGATLFSFFHHMYTMGLSSPFPYEAIYLLDHEKINLNKYNVTPLIKDAGEGFACGNFDLSTNIVLVNGSRQVEDKYIDYLSVLSKKRIVSTGPLIAHANNNNYDDDYDDDVESSEVMKWLNGKNRVSTVYISFGSECFLSDEQIGEIAKGLQLINRDANFIWVIRFPLGDKTISVEEKLPGGFLEKAKERGINVIITRWAPQAKILRHPSVGVFVSHCGSSSIMESLYFGVPIIGMPMKVDQLINARLVVEAGVGVEVEKDTNGNYSGDEVAKAINKVMAETKSFEGMKDRAKRLSQKIKENEDKEVNETSEQLLRICMKNKKCN